MRFEKWQALGNDYVIVEADACPGSSRAERVQADLRAALRGRLRRHPAARRRPRTRATSPTCGSSTPTARRPSSRATARARRSSTCAGTGWTDADEFSIVHRGRADHADDHLRARRARSRWAGPRPTSQDYPVGPDGRPRRARGRRARAGASSTSRSATRSARSRSATSSRSSTWPRSGPAIESTRAVPEPHQRLVLPASTATARSARGSSSAGWGRRSPRAPAPAAPRSRRSSAARASPITVELDGGELRSRSATSST